MRRVMSLLCGYFPYIRVLFSMIWLSLLSATDAYFSVYVLIAFLSFFLQLRSQKFDSGSQKKCVPGMILSAIFSLAVWLSNYSIFTSLGDPALIGRSTSIVMNLINSGLVLFGGFFVFHPIIVWFLCSFPRKVHADRSFFASRWFPWIIFFSLVFINGVHLFLVEYPGNLSQDSFTQISEMVSGLYSNFNTYWHTMLFRLVLSIGYRFVPDINVAVSVFTFLQLIILCGAFTYSLITLRDLGVPKAALFVFYLIYAVVPYNIALSITVWKDVLFAAATLYLLCAWLRILKRSGKSQVLNYVFFMVGSLLFLLSRNNGWIIYLITFLFVVFFLRKPKALVALMGGIALLGWFLLNPALDLLGVSGGDPVESFSVPIQQVSRVIAYGHELSEEDSQLLSRIVDLEEVPVLYTSWLSDPMKVEVRSKDPDYFIAHLSEFGKLWVRLGVEHPWEYLKAWVDQTKGYWNGGYDYPLYSETITDNPYGVEKTVGGNPIASVFRLYFGLSRHLVFFEPLHSIGLHIWILILCFILNLKKGREVWILSVPLLVLVVGLWAGTPVYACFRYVYPVFVSFPLILSTALWDTENA